MFRQVEVSELQKKRLFSSLFSIEQGTMTAIAMDMKKRGYDESKPIDIWAEEQVILDGHTRLLAAQEAGIEKVPIFEHSFPDEDAALLYVIHNQRDRRNWTDAQILEAIVALEDSRGRHAPHRMTSSPFEESLPVTAKEVSDILGVSEQKIASARTIIDYGDKVTELIQTEDENGKPRYVNKSVQEAVRDGDISIYTGATIVRQAIRPIAGEFKVGRGQEPQFNRTNENIEWAWWTWNPVTGCKHGCVYCYARDIANRFYKEGFKPTFHPRRLTAPKNTRVPTGDGVGAKGVFVCSMADLFGEWVPQEWIDAILKAVAEAPQWNFLFLTKNPKRLVGIEWPVNAWVGTTVDVQDRVSTAEKAFVQIDATVKFLSCEPLLEPLTFSRLDAFDWLIIGARSKCSSLPEFQPDWHWVHDLTQQGLDAKCSIYWKPNLMSRPKEYPVSK